MMAIEEAVGVIGGVGPMATAYYLEQVIAMTDAATDQDHVNMIIFNHCTIADRTAFILGESDANPLPVLMEDAKRLAECGCRFIAIPCNTAHYFYDAIQECVDIPVINIVSETIRYAQRLHPGLHSVGIMATNGTVATHTYQRYAEEAGLAWIVPDAAHQEAVMHMIYDGVKAGASVPRADFDVVANHLRAAGAECILLGCTELSVLKRDLPIDDADVLDSIDVLAAETIRRAEKPFSAQGCALVKEQP